jgi:cytochrome c-type biogenesis protein CcmH
LIFPFLLAGLAFLTLLAIVAPLMRGQTRGGPDASYDQAVYRDQLEELDRDIERGLLTADDASSARLEIQRRLLAADRAARPAATLGPGPSRNPAVAVVVFLVVAAGSIGTYLRIGAPGMPDMPFAGRPPDATAAADSEQIRLRKAADQLADRVKVDPSDAKAWLLLGRTDALLSRWDDAIAAYRQAIALGQTDTGTTAALAEVLVMGAGGTVTPAAEAAFKSVLAADPASGVARYYLGLAASQAGEPRKAIDLWQGLLAEMPADSPMRGQIGARIAEAAGAAGIPPPPLATGTSPAAPGGSGANAVVRGGVPPDTQAGSSSDEQQQAMINGMVARLAARQAADPANLDGWMRLGRAYAMLRDTDKATDAYDKAMALKPDDPAVALQAAQDLSRAQDPNQPLSPRLIAVLKQAQATNPKEAVVLWFLGIAALQERHPDEAKRYWTDLLGVLPASSPDARTVQSALDMLAKGGSASGG